jgi:hypothetical protein
MYGKMKCSKAISTHSNERITRERREEERNEDVGNAEEVGGDVAGEKKKEKGSACKGMERFR